MVLRLNIKVLEQAVRVSTMREALQLNRDVCTSSLHASRLSGLLVRHEIFLKRVIAHYVFCRKKWPRACQSEMCPCWKG